MNAHSPIARAHSHTTQKMVKMEPCLVCYTSVGVRARKPVDKRLRPRPLLDSLPDLRVCVSDPH